MSILPNKYIYKMIRVFDPRQASAMERQTEAYGTLWELRTPSPELSEQWATYQHCVRNEGLSASLDLADYWKGTSQRFPGIAKIATSYIQYTSQSVLLTVRGVSASTKHCSLTRESLLLSSTPSAFPSCTSMEMCVKDEKCPRKQHVCLNLHESTFKL